MVNNITLFPNEILTSIFSFLEKENFPAIETTCKRFHEIIQAPFLWRPDYNSRSSALHGAKAFVQAMQQLKLSQITLPARNKSSLAAQHELMMQVKRLSMTEAWNDSCNPILKALVTGECTEAFLQDFQVPVTEEVLDAAIQANISQELMSKLILKENHVNNIPKFLYKFIYFGYSDAALILLSITMQDFDFIPNPSTLIHSVLTGTSDSIDAALSGKQPLVHNPIPGDVLSFECEQAIKQVMLLIMCLRKFPVEECQKFLDHFKIPLPLTQLLQSLQRIPLDKTFIDAISLLAKKNNATNFEKLNEMFLFEEVDKAVYFLKAYQRQGGDIPEQSLNDWLKIALKRQAPSEDIRDLMMLGARISYWEYCQVTRSYFSRASYRQWQDFVQGAEKTAS